MGRDSRGRAQEAQWKLMLQGTKVSPRSQRTRINVMCLLAYHVSAWLQCMLSADELLSSSQYADRLPIGLESVIRNVPAETVKAFYDRLVVLAASVVSLWCLKLARHWYAADSRLTPFQSLPSRWYRPENMALVRPPSTVCAICRSQSSHQMSLELNRHISSLHCHVQQRVARGGSVRHHWCRWLLATLPTWTLW